MGSLSNLYISQSYQSLIHLATNNTASATLIGLEDGLGNPIGVSVNTAGNLYLSGTFSASLQEGYIYVGNASGRTIAFPTSSFVNELETGSLLTTASFNAYTASTNIRLSNIEIATASILVSISNLNASSASQQVSINALNSYTQSNDQKWNNLAGQSGSWITESETGSFARTNAANTFTADQTITGNLNVSGIISASVIHTIFETASVIYSSGSNQFGDELTDVQTLSGSVRVRGELLVNGVNVTSSLNSINTFTASANIRLNNLESTSASVNVSITNLNASSASQQVSINALNAFSASQIIVDNAFNVSITNLNSFTQSADIRLDNLEAATSSYAISASVAAVDAAQQAQINSLINATGSYVTESESGSFLITASFDNGTRNLTFTKGDASTFAVNIPDVSGSTGNFVTTSSFNAYTASNDQRVGSLEAATSSYVTETESGSFLITASFASQTLTFTKGDGTTFGVLIPDISGSTIDTGSFVTTSSFNAYTASNDQRVTSLESNSASVNISIANINTFTQSADQRLDSIEAQSGSWVTSAITGSSIITASVVDDDITFTKGDGSTFTIQVATGSFAISASYAETASIARNLVVVARNGNQSTLPIGTVVHITSAVGDNPIFNTASFDTELLSANTLGVLRQAATSGTDVEVVVQGTVTSVNTDPTLGYAAGDVIYLSSSGQFTRVQPQAPNQIVVLGQVLRAQQNNGSIYVSINNGWELNELHNVQINGVQTGDLIQYESSSYGLWKNKSIDGAGITTTSSFNAYTSSTNTRLTNIEATTASLLIETQNLELFTSSQAQLNGTFATTGSNTFRGTQTLEDTGSNGISLVPVSSSLMLVGRGFTSASAHFLSSATTGSNIILKNDNNATTTIISGSYNIIANQTAPTAGFTRLLGNQNLALSTTGIPAISSSMTSVPWNFFRNVWLGATNIRGPVSSSQYTIGQSVNIGAVNLGISATQHFERARAGLNFNQNSVLGTLNYVANTTDLTQVVMTGNSIQGVLNINAFSSSVNMNNTFHNGQTNISSSYVPPAGAATTNAASAIVGCFFYGNQTNVFFSGSNTATNVPRQMVHSGFIGSAISASLNGNGDSSHMIATFVAGHSLRVTGSNTAFGTTGVTPIRNDYGSTFLGRFNSTDGNRAKTAETVLAVGTGTSGSAKTGFLIDSGSNTYVEGTFNVSGSSTFTGSVSISNVLQLAQQNPLPAGVTGQLAVSSSLLWFYDATQWRQVSLV